MPTGMAGSPQAPSDLCYEVTLEEKLYRIPHELLVDKDSRARKCARCERALKL